MIVSLAVLVLSGYLVSRAYITYITSLELLKQVGLSMLLYFTYIIDTYMYVHVL